MSNRWRWSAAVGLALAALEARAAVPKVDFTRDIRPILSDKCFACHGPDGQKVKGGLRLDVREAALRPAKSGEAALVPGRPEASELVRRISTSDEDDLMPPPSAHKTLTVAERGLLKRWVAEGAEYAVHWAYVRPVKPVVPAGVNGVDFLVRARLRQLGLKPVPEADRRTLARRLYGDLIGMPPKPEEVAAFEKDSRSNAYDQLVERLLASPHHGERMAVGWLDVARFADTIGYHSDNPRPIWPYRDYVIRSFNENKRFDEFTREQLAGDLLPQTTREQKVASGFNRLLLTTEEGGAQPKDYEARQLTDRVRAVSAVWLGLTMGCAQCHDHKFDPITAKDFYSFGAFFSDIQEPAIGSRGPGMLLPDEVQAAELARLRGGVEARQREFEAWTPELETSFLMWQEKSVATNEVAELLRIPAGERNSTQQERLRGFFRDAAPELAGLRGQLADARKALTDYEATVPRTLVTERLDPPRVVRVLPRGNFLIEDGEVVEPALPAFLVSAGGGGVGRRLNRLDLADWLVSRENPMTARVVMNRLWKQFFGTSLSKVLDDFGSQGEPPSNAALLDWLACEFMDSGWDQRHMVRLIVTSQTYRERSIPTRDLKARDPENREFARQGRWRLEAEFVRDQALSVAGLLVPTIGGPSVKPYQPEGYWENLNFPPRTYEPSTGPGQYRRGLYVWWQRSFLHPSLLAFDAPSREECVAERNRSNIPQQALVLLNDPTYVEAARSLAVRILREGGGDEKARIQWAWRAVLARAPRRGEVSTLRTLFEKHLEQYRRSPETAAAYLKTGASPVPADLDPAELAAWTDVARVLLNLHETITRS